jgi:hypothetical protein
MVMREFALKDLVGLTDEHRIGVRGALHQALLKRGIDPIPRDPWYYPTARQYELVGDHTHTSHPS